jgi:hypothetical protein
MQFRGVHFVGTMARVQASYAITSIANTNSEAVERDEPVLVAEIELGTEGHQQGVLAIDI